MVAEILGKETLTHNVLFGTGRISVCASLIHNICIYNWPFMSAYVGDYKRRRHHSQRSMEEEDDAAMEDALLDQHYTIEVQGGNFTWHLNKEEITLKDISVKIPTGRVLLPSFLACLF